MADEREIFQAGYCDGGGREPQGSLKESVPGDQEAENTVSDVSDGHNLEPGDLVVITWRDSGIVDTDKSDNWDSLKTVDTMTAGFFVSCDEENLRIASDYSPGNNHRFGTVHAIWIPSIKEIRKLPPLEGLL